MRSLARRGFVGSRLGRGAAAACVLGDRGPRSALRSRRAVVKTRLVRLAGNGLAAARAHLRYIQRDGAPGVDEGERGALYSSEAEGVDGKSFLERCAGDRHQFRLIVSAEDGAQYDDLRPLIRRWMAQMEADLGTRLEWVAADHLDTGHPHSHVILRGADERGADLVIARDYIASGMRERLAELVTLDLGPRTALEIAAAQRREVAAERLTGIDRGLLREADRTGLVAVGAGPPHRRALRVGRLRKLERLGLAEPAGAGRWRLDDRLAERLRSLGERGDIVRTLQRSLGRPAAPADLAVHAPGPPPREIVGRLAARGLADELRDRHYLVVEAVDGRAHYVDIGPGEALGPIEPGAIVRLSAARPGVREADRAIAAVAAANGGIYSPDLHRAHDRSAGAAFAEAHVRRLEAVRRGTGAVERLDDGCWRVGAGYLDAVRAAAAVGGAAQRVEVEVLSPLALEALPRARGATWLDRELLSASPLPLRDAGFGRAVRDALAARRQWLLDQGLAREERGAAVYPGDLLARLRRQDVLRAGQGLSEQLGLEFSAHEDGAAHGRLVRRVDLASGRFALLARARDFSLVPWREGLERRIGRELRIDVRAGRTSWRLARGRAGPEIG